MKKEILAASQFICAAKEEKGVEFKLKQVKLGRLEFCNGEKNKVAGYVCFYAIRNKRVYYLKAFQGKSERVVRDGVIGVDVKEKPGTLFVLGNEYPTAYKNTIWAYVASADKKDYFLKQAEILSVSQFIEAAKIEKNIDFTLNEVRLGRLSFHAPKNLEGVESEEALAFTELAKKQTGYICFYAIKGEQVYYMKAFKGKTLRRVGQAKLNSEVKESFGSLFRPGNTYRCAYKNTSWRYVFTDDRTDCQLIEEEEYRRLKREKELDSYKRMSVM